MLARIGDEAVIITRANNAPSIEGELPRTPERDRLRFEYVDLPRWARFWKRGPRGARLYYMLWQVAALRRAREIGRRSNFTIVWHLTLANAWLGSLASLAGVPFIYGPVGGGVTAPWKLLPHLGARGMLYEGVRGLVRFMGRYLNPSARLAWRSASLILVQNPETLAWLPTRYRAKARVFANAIVEDVMADAMEERRASQTALFAGRLVGWKGIELGMRAVAITKGWRFLICGEGPDKTRLRRLADRLGLDERVQFLGHVRRDEVLTLMKSSDVFLYPSLHDDSPLAIAEAMACGLPVVCLDRGGPPVLIGNSGGRSVPSQGSVQRISEALATCLDGGLQDRAAVIAGAKRLTVASRAEQLRELLVSEGFPLGGR
jgi:glycosyltransferase involved in cell wall biosynthesis